jgi:hypothetical protein
MGFLCFPDSHLKSNGNEAGQISERSILSTSRASDETKISISKTNRITLIQHERALQALKKP